MNCHQRRHDFQTGRSNSLPSSAVDAYEMNRMWEVFWATSGEQLIWSSWIEKFGEFINPEYTTTLNDKPEENQTINTKTNHPETEIRISSCSPAAHPEVYITPSEHLLSPRCESVTSSIPITIATTDSMTNVTNLTLSSGDFGRTTGGVNNNNHFQSESESLNSSEMLTSTSSNSSQSPEDELLNTDEAEAKVLAELWISGNGFTDDALDSDQHWQILWQKHFQEQYTEQYRQFMETKRAEVQSGSSVPESSFDEVPVQTGSRRRSSRKLQTARALVDLPVLVSGLNISNIDLDVEVYDGEGNNEKTVADDGPPDEVNNPDVDVMAAMGLPTAFGSSKPVGGGGGGDGNRNPNEKGLTMKRG